MEYLVYVNGKVSRYVEDPYMGHCIEVAMFSYVQSYKYVQKTLFIYTLYWMNIYLQTVYNDNVDVLACHKHFLN